MRQVMAQLKARYRPPAPGARDPAPSRLSYRLHRLTLTPLYQRGLQRGLPVFCGLVIAAIVFGSADRRATMSGWITGLRQGIAAREEFMVRDIRIAGASDLVEREIRAVLDLALPLSSFDLDLESLHLKVSALDAVARADLRVRSRGVLQVAILQRVPAIVWRRTDGLELLDAEGHRVADLPLRAMRADLPLIAGQGASAAVPEALALMEVAGPMVPRMRGMIRVGDRRWDVVLGNGQRIMLPMDGAVPALEQVIALDQAQDLLGRDVAVVDMRHHGRPTLRLGPGTALALRKIKLTELGAD